MLDKISRSPNDRRKNQPERRTKERRRNWVETSDQRDEVFWRYEFLYSRRRKLGEQRKGEVNRRKMDRRKGEERRRKSERRGSVLQLPIPVRVPEHVADVAEIQVVSGGKRKREKLGAGLDLSGPAMTYKPLATDSSPKPEDTRFRAVLREMKESLRSLWSG